MNQLEVAIFERSSDGSVRIVGRSVSPEIVETVRRGLLREAAGRLGTGGRKRGPARLPEVGTAPTRTEM